MMRLRLLGRGRIFFCGASWEYGGFVPIVLTLVKKVTNFIPIFCWLFYNKYNIQSIGNG
jgi:hypothetical protein